MRRLRSAFGLEAVILGDLVLLEVLQGIADEREATRAERWLRSFDNVRLLDGEAAVRTARNYRALRLQGITVRKTVDLVIGTYCIDHGLKLLHDDRDFQPMAEHLGLRVAEYD